MYESTPSGVTRRRFIAAAGTVGAAGATALVTAGPSSAQPSADVFTEADREIVLRVTRIGAVFPFTFPDFGEAGRPQDRATHRRLTRALERTDTDRRVAARSAARDLARTVGVGNDRRLLDELGRRAGPSDDLPAGLVAVVALGVATVARSLDPNDDDFAAQWLGSLGRMHADGTLRHQAAREGVR